MINLSYEWDGSFDPSDFGLALNWIKNVSRNFWQNVTSDFFVYFIIVMFVLPPVIYIIGCLIIDMVNYRVPYPSHNSPYKGVYDNGQGVWNKNNTVWGAALRRSKWQKKNLKKNKEPTYDVIKDTYRDSHGNKRTDTYYNGVYKGTTTYVNKNRNSYRYVPRDENFSNNSGKKHKKSIDIEYDENHN